MGRHSSPDQAPFYRSLAGWVFPWTMVAIVFGVGVWLAVRAVGSSELETRPRAALESASPSPRPTRSTPTPTKPPTPLSTGVESSPAETNPPELITAGVTIQVLNGTASATADDRMADKLAGLGFEVVAIEASSTTYPSTTVFWSTSGAEDAARALAERFGWIAASKPANLSSDVSLHVVVGADEV